MKRGFLVRCVSGITLFAVSLLSAPVFAAEVHVMISAGFFKAYSELVPVFEQQTGHTLVTIRGPSLGDSPEAIPNRLARGEPADVLIMVGASIDDLAKQGLSREGSKVNLARSEIGMVVREGAPTPDISGVEAFKRALLNAKSIAHSDSASGIYLSTTLFQQLGIAEQLAGKSRKIQGPPSGEPVAAVVARGEAEIGFQQVSELIHEPGVTYVGPIPAELQQETYFSAALVSAVKQPEAAQALIDFLASPAAAKAISDAGLAPLAAQ
jgi:molybdate transport system substrate-binding protein